jgi:hypothetical protein
MGRHALPEEQTCRHDTVERRLKFGLGLFTQHRSEQGMGELSPDHRSDLCQLFGRTQSV